MLDSINPEKYKPLEVPGKKKRIPTALDRLLGRLSSTDKEKE